MRLLKLLLIGLMFTILYACGGGSGGGTSGDSSGDDLPEGEAVFTPGSDVVLETASIGENGGTVTISGTDTALDGAVITFPSGALDNISEITVGYNTGNVALPEGVSSSAQGGTLYIHSEGGSTFSQPVEITLPFDDASNVPVPFYVDENGVLRPVLVTNVDTVNKTFTFVTTHTSVWAWIVDVLTDSPDEDTGFRPLVDGFNIANMGSSYHTGGECFGMTTFAQWYYDQKREGHGGLYDRYLTSVGTDVNGDSVIGQDVIATRAFSAANQSWNWSEYILPNINTTDEYRYKAIVSAIKLTKRPVNLSIKSVGENGQFTGGHAVLAYGVDESDGQLFIYDPNHPGDTTYIIYDTETKQFQPYGNYTKFFLNGTGTYSLNETYENIFQDAQHSFTSDNKPQISITSHTNGEVVTTRNIQLVGVVESSEVLITNLDVFVGTEKFSTLVDNSGNFSVGVSLKTGENKLSFVTKGRVSGELVTVSPNNMDANPFSINVNVDSAVMLVTLTWDKNDTDVDLYVIDPNGDYSAYFHKFTADGGELDYDITTGYGPEHWTLTTTDTIRWNGEYLVRLHYYSDHNDEEEIGTNFKISVKLYEETDYEVEYIMTGYLGASNPSNDAHTGTGADWVDFYFPIVLDPAVYGIVLPSGASAFVPRVTCDIPSAAERRALKK
ncbi:MAG: YfaP family protein [Deferribacterales bacterium]